MSEKNDILFEIQPEKNEVTSIGLPLDCNVLDLRIIVNDVDITRHLKIKSFKIVKVLK